MSHDRETIDKQETQYTGDHEHMNAVEKDFRNGGWMRQKQDWEESGINQHETIYQATDCYFNCKQIL